MSQSLMSDMKQKDMIKLLEQEGFRLARSSKHLIYKKNSTTIAIPHGKTIKRNTVKQILKSIEGAR